MLGAQKTARPSQAVRLKIFVEKMKRCNNNNDSKGLFVVVPTATVAGTNLTGVNAAATVDSYLRGRTYYFLCGHLRH